MKINRVPGWITFCAAWLAVAMAATSARANDGYIDGVAGSPTVAQKEHSQIRMESEKVVLTLLAGGKYRTDARFRFVNDSGKNVTVRMGFPEGSSIYEDEYLNKNTFLKFKTTVNGQRIKARRTVVKNFGDASNVWWIKTVSFAPHERKNVRVMALSQIGVKGFLGGGGYGYIGQMGYDFTGANWKGLVGRSDLEVRFPLDGLWAVSALSLDDKKSTYWTPAVETKNGVGILRKTWRNWQAQSDVVFSLRRVMPAWMDSDAYGYETNAQELAHTVTFRAGNGRGELGAGAPVGFVRAGVSFVSFKHLVLAANVINSKVRAASQWNAVTRTATLQRGKIRLSFTPGRAEMTLQRGDAPAQQIKLRAAPRMLEISGKQSLYIPMAAPVRALGLKLKVEPKQHWFKISK